MQESPGNDAFGAVRSRFVETVVGRLHVLDRGTGAAVVCWPSLYCDARTLAPLIDHLALTHRVIVIEGPGHGLSGAVNRFTLADCAIAATQVFDAHAVERAVWIGPAWGGHVGVMLATQHPERLLGLAILNAPMNAWRGRKRALMRTGYALLWAFGPRSFVSRMIADTMIAESVAGDRSALVELIVASLHECNKRSLLVAARSEMFERASLLPELARIRVPTLFITGSDDMLYPIEEARAHATLIPGSRFVIVDGSAHQSILEAPTTVVPMLAEFVEQHTGASERLASGFR